MKIIFILYNIFEVKSGVSNKYIKFIDCLSKNNINYLLITSLNNFSSLKYSNKIINLKGLNIPFYSDIKIPNIDYDELKVFVNDNDIIIFHGEFYWIYNTLNKIKKKYNNIKLIPNWHTNYDYYANIYFKNNSILKKIKNILFQNLKNNFFSGIITTGEISKNIFLQYTSNVFNANEICLDNFSNFKIDKYKKNNTINFIYTGRIALEKNLLLIIDILNNLENTKFENYKMHFIGSGPYLKKLKKYLLINDKIIFYGDTEYSQIIDIYNNLDNRIFIQSSVSETFGKSTMEACYSGIPVFVLKCEIHDLLYNDNNSFIFESVTDFKNQLTLFFKLNKTQKELIINNAYNNAKKYDQKIIFNNLKDFILNINENSNNFYNEFFINNVFSGIKCGIDYFQN